jgi:guanylate kinase
MKFNRPTLVTLTAPTSSGKTFLLNELVARGLAGRIVSTTTRNKRVGELEGVDYYFCSDHTSRKLEEAGFFFELIEFNGIRYGVTTDEMHAKMSALIAPAVVLEPQGLEIYRKKCVENGWDMFSIYIHATEAVRLERLHQRTLKDMELKVLETDDSNFSEQLWAQLNNLLHTHTKRVLSITGDERRWSQVARWDVIVPGDDIEKAISLIEDGVTWCNRRRAEPKAIGAVSLPLNAALPRM